MLILGSQSPRRKEILSYFSLPFRQVSPLFDEKSVSLHLDPREYAMVLAKEKGLSLAPLFSDDIILTADTIVFAKHKIFNKPSNAKEAFEMLMDLSGSWHQVLTGVCVIQNKQVFTGVEETKILFHPLTEKQIEAYHKHFYFLDKAGAYAIQEGGGILIKKMEGCFYNAMGLPLNTVNELLLKVGLDLWNHLKS